MIVLGWVPSMAATMCLVTAFFDPLTCDLAHERTVGADVPGLGRGDASIGARVLAAGGGADEPERHASCVAGSERCPRTTLTGVRTRTRGDRV